MNLRGCGRRFAGSVSLVALSLSVAACGGGGGGVNAPSQNPPPAPTPTPTPTPTSFDTEEYRRSDAAVFSGAITAYQAGATGAGVKIAVLDSGVDLQSAEFTGRIDPASRDIVSGRSIDDEDGHGTSVSAVALAAKNDREIHGVAFNATLIALRTDSPGTCSDDDGCSHDDNDLAEAVDVAVSAGARVINMSLGGSAANSQLRNAIANATAAGVIVVISAGNDSANSPDPLALIATDPGAARGRVLIAGSVNASGLMSDFSNRAGSGSQHYLAALGEDVRSFDHQGTPFLYSGTSYAAPSIAAAVALVASAFPNMTADQIVDLLYRTARDAGALGVDAIYGRGILDLARAFTPQGSTSLAGTKTPIVQQAGSVAVIGGALGDGGKFGESLGGVVLLDAYDRAFVADLAERVTRAAPRPKLAAALALDTIEAADALGAGSYSVSIKPGFSGRPWVGFAHRGMDAAVDEDARVTRGFVTGNVAGGTSLGLASGYGADDLLARMAGSSSPARFIASSDTIRDDGLAIVGTTSTAVIQRLGAWTLGVAASEGAAAPLMQRHRFDRNDVSLYAASLSRPIGAGMMTLSFSELQEAGTILGGEGSAALGIDGATSRFVGLDASTRFRGWRIAAAARGGLTTVNRIPGGLVADAAPLKSLAWSVDAVRAGAIIAGDTFGLRISQPLRVEGGRVSLDVPVSYDYETLGVSYERRVTSLAPSGREIDVEAAWSVPFGFGTIDTNLFWRTDPGHVRALADDLGAALRLKARF